MSNPINPTGGSSAPQPTSAPSSPAGSNVGSPDSSWAVIELADAGTSSPQAVQDHASVGQFSESQGAQNAPAVARQATPDTQTLTTAARNANPVARFFRALVDLLTRCFTRQAQADPGPSAATLAANSARYLSHMAAREQTAVSGLIQSAEQDPSKARSLPGLLIVDGMLSGAKTIDPALARFNKASKDDLVNNLTYQNMFRPGLTAMTTMDRLGRIPGGVKQLLASSHPEIRMSPERTSLEGTIGAAANVLEKLVDSRYNPDDPQTTLRALASPSARDTGHKNPYVELSKTSGFTNGGANSEDTRVRAWATKSFQLGQQAVEIIKDAVVNGVDVDTNKMIELHGEVDNLIANPRGS